MCPPRAGSLAVLSLLFLCLTSCASTGKYRDGVFYGKEVSYRIAEPGAPWERLYISDNDLAWEGRVGEVIAVNATCSDHGDPSLQVLTNHLLMGFDARQIEEREELMLSGRGALRTRVVASIDGVPSKLELVVLKKDGCVYDLSYLAPIETFSGSLPQFQRLVSSFDAMGRGR